MFNYFVFDGHDSRDYGVYISGSGTFNSAAREYDNISIPGRDGDLLGLNTRLQNVTLTYPAGVVSDFSNNIAGLRNMLLSTVGYAVLRDSYHPDEYRYAVYKGGLTPDPLSDLSAAEFNITFECKPQRYLDSGGEVRDVDAWGTTDTETGAVVSFDGEPQTGIKDLTVAITAVQAGTGDPSPTNVRAISGWTGANVSVKGKNLLAPWVTTQTYGGIAYTANADGTFTTANTATANSQILSPRFRLPAGAYKLSGCPSGGSTSTYYMRIIEYSGSTNTAVGNATDSGSGVNYTVQSGQNDLLVFCAVQNGKTAPSGVWSPMLRLASDTDATYTPYTGTTTPISWQSTAGTVYGGTLDVTTGELTVTHDIITIDGVNVKVTSTNTSNNVRYFYGTLLPVGSVATSDAHPIICDRFKSKSSVAAGNAYVSTGTDPKKILVFCLVDQSISTVADANTWFSSNNTHIVYELATPTTYTLTPEQVETLIGVNNVWADCGAVTVEYGDDPAKLLNPTLMPARPLIRVYGYGTLVVGNVTVTISNYSLSYIDIDSAMMDCYSGSTNLNSYVTFSGNDFPTLGPGATGVSYSGNITKVLITTNWWRV